MTIAVPLDNALMLYHDNPFTAPKFAIYFINGDKTNVSFKRTDIAKTPPIRSKTVEYRSLKFQQSSTT
ncbi:hypothetical protein KKC15_02300 [bacterium]|nr:hypothetical protein [bacterium]